MSKILCPVDFSPTSLNAIEFATELAEKNQSALHLVYVFTENEFNTIVSSEHVSKTYKELLAVADNKLKALAEEITSEGKNKGLPSVDTELALGDLKETILKLVRNNHYDMIVMGTTGHGKNMFVGSNTSHIVEKSTVPVLCVPDECSYDGFRRIIYATDIQEEDKLKLQEVVSMATLFDSRVTVLHINEYHSMLEKSVIEEFFQELGSFLKYDKLKFDSFDFSGSLSEGLMDYMNHNNGDLLAVYSQRRNYLESLLHKSVSKKLSVVSEKPLWVLK